ncbi:hypothetical protein H2198_002480 [Neophaeococcomyces mojaviensis]|uniref:Uncharacterized protein n=1 Tax=Neophaeococcomyces mojaviensis TaxID=3383035 RepID=A0ACC3AE40_9EURO|nr:hypothetical protein H2198_002480 [Knufia sp. JES_112]
MDIDIADILADISRPSGQQSSHPTDSYDASTAYTDHILLTRAWTTERCTPTLQQYPASLIDRVMNRLRAQITRIEDLTSGAYDDDDNSNSTPGQPVRNRQNQNLVLSILQTDLSRTQFLVRSYVRQRLSKITDHATYHAKHHVPTDPTAATTTTKTLLSPSEIQFLQHHQYLLTQLYNSSFLSSLPVSLRKLDDSTGGSARMDEGPDDGMGVFVRCLAPEWGNEAEVEETMTRGGEEKQNEGASVELRMERGGVLVGRWRDVRSGVEGGMLEVL